MANVRRTVAYVFGFLYLLNIIAFVGLNYWNWSKTHVIAYDVTGHDNITTDNLTNGSIIIQMPVLKKINSSRENETLQVKTVEKNETNTAFVISPKQNKTVAAKYFTRVKNKKEDSLNSYNVTKTPKFLNFNPIKNTNIEQFSYVLSPDDVCKEDVFLVTIVTTKHSHIDERHTIRETWKSVNSVDGLKVVTLFLLGKGNSSDDWNALIEYRQFHDMVSFDFEEHYLNLTLKTLMGLKWVREHCPHAAYILKTDDDVFVNHLSLVRNLTECPRHRWAMGHFLGNSSVSRSTKKKKVPTATPR